MPPMADAIPTQPPKKRSCFLYGCLTAAILLVIGAVVAFFGIRYAYHTVQRLALEYTETTPAPLQPVEVSEAQLAALRQRVDAFGQALKDRKSAQELVLSADDINALLVKDPNYREFKDKLRVSIEGERIQGRISWPLPDIGPLKLKGRYLNGMATFQIALENGALRINIGDVEVKGRSLPAPILAQLRQENLARDVQDNPDAAKVIEQFDSIQVKDGHLILRNKVNP